MPPFLKLMGKHGSLPILTEITLTSIIRNKNCFLNNPQQHIIFSVRCEHHKVQSQRSGALMRNMKERGRPSWLNSSTELQNRYVGPVGEYMFLSFKSKTSILFPSGTFAKPHLYKIMQLSNSQHFSDLIKICCRI